jgi:hypothetical protein
MILLLLILLSLPLILLSDDLLVFTSLILETRLLMACDQILGLLRLSLTLLVPLPLFPAAVLTIMEMVTYLPSWLNLCHSVTPTSSSLLTSLLLTFCPPWKFLRLLPMGLWNPRSMRRTIHCGLRPLPPLNVSIGLLAPKMRSAA